MTQVSSSNVALNIFFEPVITTWYEISAEINAKIEGGLLGSYGLAEGAAKT